MTSVGWLLAVYYWRLKGGNVGFYFRQSARLGPFRINFSKSGIGVSAGVPGFRIGTGPRGAYVQAGIAGFYYRQSLGGAARRPTSSPRIPSSDPSSPPASSPPIPSDEVTLGRTTVIDSGSVLEMKDSTGSGLIDALVECRNRMEYAIWVLALAGVMILFGFWKSNWWVGTLGVLCLPLAYWVRIKDVERKGFVLQYDLDEGATRAVTALVETCEKIGSVSQAWYMDSSREVLDAKYHAGANAVVKRNSTRLSIQDPPYLRTNIPVPAIAMGKETLYFLPDRLLVYAGSNIGAISYRDLQVSVVDSQFIESSRSSVPSDAEVVGSTWRYVNKRGGPDRRFKDNAELPVCRYEEIRFSSTSGLREILQLSRRGIGHQLVGALAALNKATSNGKLVTKGGPP